MKRITLIAALVMLLCGCTNKNPDVTFDPKTDAEAYCEVGEKDSEAANKFWDKVESAYLEKGMTEELSAFEAIIVEKSQAAAQEYPARVAKRGSAGAGEGEVTYYPDQDAQTYVSLVETSPEKAAEFMADVVDKYNTDGLYEDLQVFYELCGIAAE